MKPDDRIVNSEGEPFGPLLVKILRDEAEGIDYPVGFDDRCRIAVVLSQAADYIAAVVEGKGPDAARIAQLEAERAASVERRAAYMGVEKVRAERDEAYALLEEARPYLVAMEDVVDNPKGEGVKPNDAMRLVGEIDRLIGGAK